MTHHKPEDIQKANEAAARGLVDRNNFAFNEDQLSTDIDTLAAALQKGE
jgi:hypothetical protein